ncbi:hypothetical protein NGM99_10295 [Mesorhizobium sp. RP14(2022)]|uniref:Uncharacterized protein n=1 Tax=Mesorhizobium liriopis TaxID=2953882 RepID=A0ABT1C5R9_9HYPH|nr:hypothetical protein [Mesorhizobium liriopis]MCO6050174.1 hypothetical protein [Mesorhizobium liriopis]
MVVRAMPAEIINLPDFETDMTTVARLIRKHRGTVKLNCPHDQALDRLFDALLATLRDVTGEPIPPWAEDAALRKARRERKA